MAEMITTDPITNDAGEITGWTDGPPAPYPVWLWTVDRDPGDVLAAFVALNELYGLPEYSRDAAGRVTAKSIPLFYKPGQKVLYGNYKGGIYHKCPDWWITGSEHEKWPRLKSPDDIRAALKNPVETDWTGAWITKPTFWQSFLASIGL